MGISTQATRPVRHTRRVPESMLNRCAYWRAFFKGKCCWFGLPGTPIEHFVSVEHFFVWRQHLMWSKRNGDELRDLLTQRFASSTVFLSLLLSTELGVLFSPSEPAERIRDALSKADHDNLGLWTGLVLCMSVFLTVCALVATFTAWAIFAPLNRVNVHSILRSTIGLYAAQMPSNLILLAIYFFFAWVILFFYILMPFYWAIGLSIAGFFLMTHIISTYSAVGRIIIHTGAMGEQAVLSVREQEMQSSDQLYDSLVRRTKAARKADIPVNAQYRIQYRESIINMVGSDGTGFLEDADQTLGDTPTPTDNNLSASTDEEQLATPAHTVLNV